MSSIIAESTIVASSYKNNSLPLEEEGDRKLVLLTHDNDGYQLRILEFTDEAGWEVKLSLRLSSEESCQAYPPTSGYIYSLAFFDDLGGSTQRFYVFLGYGREPGQNRIWYFVFDLDDSTYRFLHCCEFDNILTEDGLATQYFRQLTLAPEDGDGICRLVVGYKQEFQGTPNVWKSFFRVGYLTLDPDENTLSFNPCNPEYTVPLLLPGTGYSPKPIQYMGVIARHELHDLVILTVGFITPTDDVLFVHELGDVENTLRYSSGSMCASLLDHPWYFAKTKITQHETTRINISIVRNVSEPQTVSFVRHSVEVNENEFEEYKIKLEDPHGEPDIPGDCMLFHLDSGDLTGDGNDDLVTIWKGCEDCTFDRYVLGVKRIVPEADSGANCTKIDFGYGFVQDFEDVDEDLSELMYVRYTSKPGGYFLSLFYHNIAGGISVYVYEYDFES